MVTRGARQCVHIKKNGQRCGANALKEVDRCAKHGGALMKANIRHGLYGKTMPPALAEMVEEQRHNPKLLDLTEQVALVSGALALCLKNTQMRMTNEKREHILEDEIATIVGVSERVQAAIERTARLSIAIKMMVHIDVLNRLIDLWVDVASDFIPVEKRKPFQQRLSAICAREISADNTKYSDVIREADRANPKQVH